MLTVRPDVDEENQLTPYDGDATISKFFSFSSTKNDFKSHETTEHLSPVIA
jgi:hypothetical protein